MSHIKNQAILKRLAFTEQQIAERKSEIEKDFEENSTRYYIANHVWSNGNEIDEPENYSEIECDCCGSLVMWTRVYEIEHESGLDSDIQYLNICKVCALDLWAYISRFDD